MNQKSLDEGQLIVMVCMLVQCSPVDYRVLHITTLIWIVGHVLSEGYHSNYSIGFSRSPMDDLLS